jgi:hypothetical protein
MGCPGTTPPIEMEFAPPLAQHSVVEGHEMLVSDPVPKGRLCPAQVVPPSVVAKTPPPGDELPKAKQVVLVGQEIDVNGPLLSGSC